MIRDRTAERMAAVRHCHPFLWTTWPRASFLGGRRVVFDIGGNKYRLVVDVRYDLGRVYVRGVLTHAEYDRRSMEGTL